MKIQFLGHASFLITSQKGTRIITDPYKEGAFDGGIGYGAINEEADVVTVSHEHDDHNSVASIRKKPAIIKGTEEKSIKDVRIKGILTHHDKSGGKERGTNTIYIMEMDNLRLVHLGDLGRLLSSEEAKKIGRVDVLFIPIGGYFTIDAQDAKSITDLLKPSITIPMHYKTPKCGFPIARVEEFTKLMQNAKKIGSSEIEISSLPESPVIYILEPSK